MARYDLSDAKWAVIAPLLPNKQRGVRRVDDRRVLNAGTTADSPSFVIRKSSLSE